MLKVHYLVEAHESGRRDYSAPIWTVLMFEAFLRNGVEGISPVARIEPG